MILNNIKEQLNYKFDWDNIQYGWCRIRRAHVENTHGKNIKNINELLNIKIKDNDLVVCSETEEFGVIPKDTKFYNTFYNQISSGKYFGLAQVVSFGNPFNFLIEARSYPFKVEIIACQYYVRYTPINEENDKFSKQLKRYSNVKLHNENNKLSIYTFKHGCFATIDNGKEFEIIKKLIDKDIEYKAKIYDTEQNMISVEFKIPYELYSEEYKIDYGDNFFCNIYTCKNL